MTASEWRMDMPVRVLLEVEMFGNRSISISLIETHKYPIPSMGRAVYLPTWMLEIYGFHVGKYTSPMDVMG